MKTKSDDSYTTNSIKKAVDWLADQAECKSAVNQQSSLKGKLKTIVNSERVRDYTLPSSGSIKQMLINIAKNLGMAGSKYADKLYRAAYNTPSASTEGKSFCLRWVVNAVNKAGLNGAKINAGSAMESWRRYPNKQHREDENIPTGAIVYGHMYSDRPVSAMSDLGHVGICVKGIDQVSDPSKILIRNDFYYDGKHGPVDTTLAKWKSSYAPYLGYYLMEEL